MAISLLALWNSSPGNIEVTLRVVLITVRKELQKRSIVDIRGTCFCSQSFAEISCALVCTWVCLSYLSRLLAGRLEFGLLARLFDLLVLGKAVGVLSVHWVFLLPQDFSTQHNTWIELRGNHHLLTDLFRDSMYYQIIILLLDFSRTKVLSTVSCFLLSVTVSCVCF